MFFATLILLYLVSYATEYPDDISTSSNKDGKACRYTEALIVKNLEGRLSCLQKGYVDTFFTFVTSNYVYLGEISQTPVCNISSIREILADSLSRYTIAINEYTINDLEIWDDFAILTYSGFVSIKPLRDESIAEHRTFYDFLVFKNGKWLLYFNCFVINQDQCVPDVVRNTIDENSIETDIQELIDVFEAGNAQKSLEAYHNDITGNFIYLGTFNSSPVCNWESLHIRLQPWMESHTIYYNGWHTNNLYIRGKLAVHKYTAQMRFNNNNWFTRTLIDVRLKDNQGDWDMYVHTFEDD